MLTCRGFQNKCSKLEHRGNFVIDTAIIGAGPYGLSLAAHLRTSDRMLLYHFGSKVHLLEAVIARAGERLADSIRQSFDPPPRRPVDVLLKLWEILTSDETAPFMRLYLELVTAALRDPESYTGAIRLISSGWLAFTQHLLSTTDSRLARTAAVDALATIDGLIVVRAALGEAVDAPAALRRLAKSWATTSR